MVEAVSWLFSSVHKLMSIEIVGGISGYTLIALQAVIIAVMMIVKGAKGDDG